MYAGYHAIFLDQRVDCMFPCYIFCKHFVLWTKISDIKDFANAYGQNYNFNKFTKGLQLAEIDNTISILRLVNI